MSNNLDLKKIEDAKTFDEIAQIRDLTFRVNEASGFDLQSLLTGGYKDPTHFIYELIQNAEDAKAEKVKFLLHSDKLVFHHDGKKLFNLKDIRAITGIGDSTKSTVMEEQKDPTIGRFGIGFKSVFKICDSPKIYSGEYNFEINNLYVPCRIEKKEEYSEGTYFVLPFSDKERTKQDTYLLLHEAIENLSSDTVLFLRNIKEISWETPNFTGSYKKEKVHKRSGNFDYFDCSIKNKETLAASYLLFERPLSIDEKLFVSIAYRTENDDNGRRIVMETGTTKLVVFFPMDGMETFLHFKVNGPYATTNTRDNLSIEPKNKKDNELILNETISLYEDSLRCIKSLGLFDINFLSKLPISNGLLVQNGHPKAFYESTRKLLTEEAFLPTANGGFANPSESLLVGSKELVELLDEGDAASVFDGRCKWLDISITPTNKTTQDIYRYINSTLGVSDIDANAFIRRVRDKFLASKDDSWLIRFYKISTGLSAIKDNLNKKFIRLENGEMVAPFTGDVPNVFLPRENIKPTEKTIKSIFCKNEDALAFFKFIDITTADIVEEIREFITVLKESENEADYLLNLKLIYSEYKDTTEEKRHKIIEILQNECCILCKNEDRSEESFFAKPTDVFVRYNNIQTIYAGISGIYYLADIIADEETDGEFMRFLDMIGINTSIRLLKLKIKNGYSSSKYKGLSGSEISDLLGKAQHTSVDEEGYQIEHIDEILSTMTEKKSLALWNALGRFDEKYFSGKLSWQYSWSYDNTRFDAYFIRSLQKTKWLFNEYDEAVSPSEVYLSDILKKYPSNKLLEKYLKFKPNNRKLLLEEEQLRLELTDGLPSDYLMQMRAAYFKELEENQDFNPEVEASDCEAPIVEEAFTNCREGTDEADVNQDEQNDDNDAATGDLDSALDEIYGDDGLPGDLLGEPESKVVARTVSNKSKKIGAWGEQLVFKRIKDRYVKAGYTISDETDLKFRAIKDGEILIVEHHNSDDKIQKGYDISIKKGEEVLEYVEVKTREKDLKQYFTVSGTQWEFCKTLEKEHHCGDKYCVYLVTKAGTQLAEIQIFRNPYKNWVDGKLEADPVCVKL